jgi:hypothetical protein
VESKSKTVDGAWIAEGTPLEVIGDQAERLGECTLTCLDLSMIEVPHPTDFKALTAPLFELVGVRRWSDFVKGTLALDVEDSGETIRLTPMRNRGARDGFDFLQDRVAELKKPIGPLELGEAIIASFGACE